MLYNPGIDSVIKQTNKSLRPIISEIIKAVTIIMMLLTSTN
jgi:hypothetical protein